MRGSKGPFLCFLLIPSHFGKISHQGDCGGANIRSGIFAYPITFWDRMRGSKGPFLCFLLIPSHFGKISHQGDCGGANIRSGTFCLSHHILGQLVTKRNAGQEIALLLTFTPVLFAIHITFWDNQSTGGMWGGDDNFFTSCSSHYILGHQREECVLGCQLLHILSITSDFGTEIHQQECGAVNVHSCSFCLSHHILGKYVTSWKTPATIACFAHHADPILLLSISRPMENQRENRHSSTSHCSHRNKGQ
ncbi:Non-reducing polyketide synthase mapC [Trichinella pseudospiralis]